MCDINWLQFINIVLTVDIKCSVFLTFVGDLGAHVLPVFFFIMNKHGISQDWGPTQSGKSNLASFDSLQIHFTFILTNIYLVDPLQEITLLLQLHL